MKTVEELRNFVDSLENSKIKFGDHPLFDLIDLRTLTNDLLRFDNLEDWLKSKNMPNHLKENVIKAILSTNPPESIKNELISFML